MLEQWSSFAIINIHNPHATGSREFPVYKKIRKQDSVGTFQFPGGSMGYGDTDPMMTLKRTVRIQTGINLNRLNTISLVHCKNDLIRNIHTGGKATKIMKSVRYYQVHIDIDSFIDRTGFEMDKDESMQWVQAKWIFDHGDFSEEDKIALHLCLNS